MAPSPPAQYPNASPTDNAGQQPAAPKPSAIGRPQALGGAPGVGSGLDGLEAAADKPGKQDPQIR